MAHTIEIMLHCLTSDSGDKTYKVTSRHGTSGTCPDRSVLFDGHSHDQAIRVARTAMRDAAARKFDRITTVRGVESRAEL